jgi:FtsP/CotA-like multicopper oxidase with cupredoxin domain
MHFAIKRTLAAIALTAIGLLLPNLALAADGGVCPRPDPGTEVLPPPDIYSSGGVLNLALNYQTSVDSAGRTLFCFTTADGAESPTLHVEPGDTVTISLTNKLNAAKNAPSEFVSATAKVCGDSQMTITSTNMHFHGLNVSPKCHGDETIRTLVNSGQTFTYKINIPTDEPPGLYWYHPHVHGIASHAVQGGGTGAIVVEGIENIQPAVAGLPQRLLVLRDQPLLNPPSHKDKPAPFWDVSVNYVAVPYPSYPAAIIKMQAGSQEFWRVANAGANTIMDIEVNYDGKPQVLQIVGLDGVPTGSQDGKVQGTIVDAKHIALPPAARAEFIVTAPPQGTKKAYFITRTIDGGPASDSNPRRKMAQIATTASAPHLPRVPKRSGPPNKPRFPDLMKAKVTANRTLYFSEVPRLEGKSPPELVHFFITVDGQLPKVYDPNNPPAITTTRGAVEDWVIQNRTSEMHDFHIHQVHFLLLDKNGKPVPKREQQFHDTIELPYFPGSGDYPSVKVRMDFRGAVIGDFVYHCHILDHEDGGMMAIIRVLPGKA